MKTRLEESVGALLHDHADEQIDPGDYVEARHRFVEKAVGASRPAQNAWLRATAFATAFSVVCAGALFLHSVRSALTFDVGAARSSGSVPEYLVAPSSEETPLYFSDGSLVTLSPLTRARVERTTARGAALVLESGTLSANIVHRGTTDWTFFAGPYAVRVTGTAFVLSWDPSGALAIHMKAGSVLVHGPGAEDGILVRDELLLSTAAPPPKPAPLPTGEIAPLLRIESAPIDPPRNRPESRPEHRAPVEPAAPRESWSELVVRGEYRRVLGLAEERGVDSTLSSASVDDLQALADAARFAGRSDLAERTLLHMRTRFPGSSRARAASFLVGRMKDDAGNARGAVEWYDQYLSDAPFGPLAAEALGRRMVCLRRLHESEKSERAAKDYLQRFPNGAYAGVAREITPP
jgi:hypothetical protein